MPSITHRDNLFATPLNDLSDFRFDEAVADVFPDMIQRSVPGYATILHTIGELGKRYAQPHSRIYDLGCSLGAASLAVARAVTTEGCQIIAVDNSSPMVERCQRTLSGFKLTTPIQVKLGDVLQEPITDASVVIMNFTLQFIAPDTRQAMLARIWQGLRPGGILVLSEKIRHPQAIGNELLIDLHHQFKRNNGYSELEVSQKRQALEKVMLTDTLDMHYQRLAEVGFSDTTLWFSCYNFVSMVAFK
jgi:tRNA (cmo5U34)-methyltransferase